MSAARGHHDNLPAPEVIAREIVEDLEAALTEFSAVAEALGAESGERTEDSAPHLPSG